MGELYSNPRGEGGWVFWAWRYATFVAADEPEPEPEPEEDGEEEEPEDVVVVSDFFSVLSADFSDLPDLSSALPLDVEDETLEPDPLRLSVR
jgi:hypothetical protein